MHLQRRERRISYLTRSTGRYASAVARRKTMPITVANVVMINQRTLDSPARLNPVGEWRRDRLLGAGFAPELAARIAEHCEIDLHAALELVDRGCPPELAVRILAPLDARQRPC
jgi:hypothetical protein